MTTKPPNYLNTPAFAREAGVDPQPYTPQQRRAAIHQWYAKRRKQRTVQAAHDVTEEARDAAGKWTSSAGVASDPTATQRRINIRLHAGGGVLDVADVKALHKACETVGIPYAGVEQLMSLGQICKDAGVPVTKVDTVLGFSKSSSGDPPELSFSQFVMNGRDVVAEVEREYRDGVLDLTSLHVDHEYQGQGIGSAYHNACYKAAAALGADHISMLAMSDPHGGMNGAYTWAMQPGWKFSTPSSRERAVAKFSKWMQQEYPEIKLPDEALRNLHTPHDIATFRVPHDDPHGYADQAVGKQFLLGEVMWYGVRGVQP